MTATRELVQDQRQQFAFHETSSTCPRPSAA